MNICFMMGHRDAPDALYSQILAAAEDYVEKHGDTEFIIGRYGHFDSMAARAIIALKKTHPGIILTQLDPYLPPKPLPTGFDRSVSPPTAECCPKKFAIIKANQYMVKNCDALIIYSVRPASNTRNILEFAQRREKLGNFKLIILRKP